MCWASRLTTRQMAPASSQRCNMSTGSSAVPPMDIRPPVLSVGADSFPPVSEQVDLLASVLTKTGDLIAQTPADARSRPSPSYDVETLVDHLVEWCTTFATSAAAGESPPSSGDGGSWPQPEAE